MAETKEETFFFLLWGYEFAGMIHWISHILSSIVDANRNDQIHLKKSALTIKLAFVIWIAIGSD